MKNKTRIIAVIAIVAMGAGTTYALRAINGPTISIHNASIVNGGGTNIGPTISTRGARIGTPIYGLTANIEAVPILEAENWNQYQ